MGKRKQKKASCQQETKNQVQSHQQNQSLEEQPSANGNAQKMKKSPQSNSNQENDAARGNFQTPNKRDNGSSNQLNDRHQQSQVQNQNLKSLNGQSFCKYANLRDLTNQVTDSHNNHIGVTQVEVRQKEAKTLNSNQSMQIPSHSDEIVLDFQHMQSQQLQNQALNYQNYTSGQVPGNMSSRQYVVQQQVQGQIGQEKEQATYLKTLNSGGKLINQHATQITQSYHQPQDQTITKSYQCYSDEKNLKTLLHSQKQLVNNYSQNYSQSANSNKMSQTAQGKVLHKNVQNQLQVQVENSYRSTQQSFNSSSRQGDQSQVSRRQEYQLEEDFDSALDEEEVEYGDEEYVDDEIVQSAFEQQNNIQNMQNQQSNLQNEYYYDEVEATQYSTYNNQTSNHSSTNQHQPQQYDTTMRNFQSNKTSNSLQLDNTFKNIQQMSIETLIQSNDQIQSDIKFCLYCIYNNYDIQQYFKQLLRMQKRLKEWSMQLSPQLLFRLFEVNIKEFMQGIRDRLIEEMRQLQMVGQKPSTRRYSCDDYLLIDKTFTKSYYLHGYNNEVLNHCMKYLNDSKYEQIRNDLRHNIWSEMRKNNEVIVSFYQHPDAHQKIFDLLIKFYTRVRDSIMGIEEMWIFCMESVFRKEPKGNLMFEQFHKQLFKKEILSHRYIKMFRKEIADVYLEYQNRRLKKVSNVLDPIIENINQILQDLDEDLELQYPEEEQEVNTNQEQIQDANNQITVTNEGDEQYEEAYEGSDQELIITYSQLQERVKQQYGGLTLAQQVEKYSMQSNNTKQILESIQYDKRCQELMNSLPNLDTETLVYIINNNLSPRDYEFIINQQDTQAKSQNGVAKDLSTGSSPDDVIISPSKNLHFLNNYLATQNEYQQQDCEGSYSEDEDEEVKQMKQMEKKRKKNLKKKRKRKEKKIMAQHQNQLEDMLKLKLLEEQQRRGVDNEQIRASLKKKLIESLGIDSSDADNYILTLSQSQSKDSKGSHSDSSQNEFQTKQTQCDDEDEAADPAIEIEFERDLERFRQRLEQPQSFQTQLKRRNSKLRPNITSEWISSLRERLSSFYQQYHQKCESPKNSNCNDKEGAQTSDGLWMKSYQRSA